MSRGAAARLTPRGRTGLSVTIRDGVAWLQLDRPEAHNRVTQPLAQALCDAAAEIELDDRIIVVVLTAAGSSFCVGVDDGGVWERRIDWVDAVACLSRPVIAAVQGDAIGEGLELALACDLRVASNRAHFAMSQLAGGRLPKHGGTQRLPRIVGRMRALDLLLTGRIVDANEAQAIGLVTQVVPHGELERQLEVCVEALRAKGPVALRYAKEAVLKGSDLTTEQGIRLEEDLYALLQTTRDRQEGIDAFLYKRKPTFRGK